MLSGMTLRTCLFVTAATVPVVAGCDKLGSQFQGASFEFAGIEHAELRNATEVSLSWSPLAVSGEVEVDVVYELFVLPDTDAPADPFGAGLASVSELVPLAPTLDNLTVPTASISGRTFYSMTWDYDVGKTFLIYLRARNQVDGQVVASPSRSVRFGIAGDRPIFAGLVESGVILAKDKQSIELSWEAAVGAVGSLDYLVFDNDRFSAPMATTSELGHRVTDVVAGKTYRFAVRARDNRGQDRNSNVVTITVPDPADRTPPDFAGVDRVTTISDKALHIDWKPSPSTDLDRYEVYFGNNLNSPIATTKDAFYVLSGLEPDSEYSITVRARDASGNVDQNQRSLSERTFAFRVPEFDGVSRALTMAGVDGLSQVRVEWLAATFDPSRDADVEGYLVYWGASNELLDYANPNFVISEPTATSHLVQGLDAGTAYQFAVRAFYQDTGSDRQIELNMKRRDAKTVARVAPTFAGVSSLVMQAVVGGQGSVSVNWSAPSTDGIWSGFVVDYELGTCQTAFSSSPTSILAAGHTSRSQLVSGLALGQNYRMRVRTYFPAADGYPELRDTNSKCKSVKPLPTAPVFSGVDAATKSGDVRDFSTVLLVWTPPLGDCTRIEVSVTQSPSAPNFNYAVLDGCTDDSFLVEGLTRDVSYYAQVRAVFAGSGGINLSAGQGKEVSFVANMAKPTGDQLTKATAVPVPDTVDHAKLEWVLPATGGAWNRIFIWRAEASTAGAAQTAVKALAAAATANGNPANAAKAIVKASTAADTATVDSTLPLVLGKQNCFLIRAAFWDNVNYSSSDNVVTKCVFKTFEVPSFAGLESAEYEHSPLSPGGDWDGTGVLKLTLGAFSGSIEKFDVFYGEGSTARGFDFGSPLMTFEPNDLVGSVASLQLPISMIQPGKLIVRWRTPGSPTSDENMEIQPINFGSLLVDIDRTKVRSTSVGSEVKLKFYGALPPGKVKVIVSDTVDTQGLIVGAFGPDALLLDGCGGLSGPSINEECNWDFDDDDLPWATRFMQVFVRAVDGTLARSPVFGHAKVPDGMVYIDRNLWPVEPGVYRERREQYSFAIDKFEGTRVTDPDGTTQLRAIGGVTPLTPSVGGSIFPNNIGWSIGHDDCQRRKQSTYFFDYKPFMDDSLAPHPARTFRYPTKMEYIVAAFDTPENPTDCNTSSVPGLINPNNSKGETCVSRYGAAHLVGNAHEFVNEVLSNSVVRRFHNFPDYAEPVPVNEPGSGQTSATAAPAVTYVDSQTGFPALNEVSVGPWSSLNTTSFTWNGISNLPSTTMFFSNGGTHGIQRLGGGLGPIYSVPSRFSMFHSVDIVSAGGGRCAIAAPAPANLRVVNDSEGSTARVRWRVWAKPVGTVVRIAVAKTAARLAEWSGESVPGSIASDLYAFNTFAGCTDTSYNSTRHELGGSLPSAVDASLGVQGRCSIDLSSLPHWERRYIRVSAKNVSGEMFSDTMIVAHVPPGMVYVDATDWPDQGRHAQAERLNETYASTHSFAIDKFEVYRNGDYLVSSAFSLPYSEDGKAFFASGCSARGTDANEEFGEWAAVGRQYRLAGGAEWVVAAFQTPDVSGPGYCYIHGSGATAALNGGSATDNCISRYGARNMIGNLWEWTAEELDPSTLPAADRVVGWDWDNAVPAATSAAGGAFANDRLYNVTSSGPHAVRRGGSYRLTGDGGIQSTGSNAGRFAIAVDTNLVDDRVDTGGRCVISAP